MHVITFRDGEAKNQCIANTCVTTRFASFSMACVLTIGFSRRTQQIALLLRHHCAGDEPSSSTYVKNTKATIMSAAVAELHFG
jgi:hypothetical protein